MTTFIGRARGEQIDDQISSALAIRFFLIALTFNPTGYSWMGWAMKKWESELSVTVLTGLLLLIGYIIYLRATLRSIGVMGMILVLALFPSVLWVLYD